jgi:hypothetical protein
LISQVKSNNVDNLVWKDKTDRIYITKEMKWKKQYYLVEAGD